MAVRSANRVAWWAWVRYDPRFGLALVTIAWIGAVVVVACGS